MHSETEKSIGERREKKWREKRQERRQVRLGREKQNKYRVVCLMIV